MKGGIGQFMPLGGVRQLCFIASFSYNSAMLFDPHDAAWGVSDLTKYIGELFDIDFRLKDIEVSGEISNFTRARSGHLYFTLKDSKAQLRCVMWQSQADRLRFDPQDGDEMVVRGRVSVYEAAGTYQMYAKQMTQLGRGNLAEAFEELKARLAEDGLFDSAHKQPIPAYPRKIGIVTSADAAALRDILNVLERRYPLVQVLIAPTLVQGDSAPAGIVRSLRWLDGRDDIDTIIVSRGGGSMEDLWAFNDEEVARTIFAARKPIISGVGHEIDFTIADFVADMRAPTPSAAAELAVPDVAELRPAVDEVQLSLARMMENRLGRAERDLAALQRALAAQVPSRQLDGQRQQLTNLMIRMKMAGERMISRRQSKIDPLVAHLKPVNPSAVLGRGYAIVRKASGDVVRSSQAVTAGEILDVQVADGRFEVVARAK